MMNQNAEMEERKQGCLFMSKQIQRRRKKVCNISCYQIWSTNNHHSRNNETSYVNCFSSPNNKLYHHQHKFVNVQGELLSVILISLTYSQRTGFMCLKNLLIQLCSNTDYYSTLTHRFKLTSEQKTRKIGYRDAICL